MKYLNYTVILILTILSFCSSCKKVDGEATPPDFDSGPHIFTKEIKDTVLISKNDKSWWFEYITVNGIEGSLLEKNNELKYYRKDPNPNSDSKLGDIYKYESSWFTIEKLDKKNIKILLKENKESSSRTVTFFVSVGNSNRKVTIVQTPK